MPSFPAFPGSLKCLFLSTLLLGNPLNHVASAPRAITASLVGTWTLTAKTTVVTPKGGILGVTYPQVVVPNTVQLTYAANGQYKVVFDKSVSATGAAVTTSGTYSYAGNTITYSANGKTSTARVSLLTDNLLIHVATTEAVGGNYVNVTTNTYIR